MKPIQKILFGSQGTGKSYRVDKIISNKSDKSELIIRYRSFFGYFYKLLILLWLQLLLGNPENIEFTMVVRPRNSKVIPRCDRCVVKYGPEY